MPTPQRIRELMAHLVLSVTRTPVYSLFLWGLARSAKVYRGFGAARCG